MFAYYVNLWHVVNHYCCLSYMVWSDRFALSRGGSEVEALAEAQSACQTNGVGLWSCPDAVPVDPSAGASTDGAYVQFSPHTHA